MSAFYSFTGSLSCDLGLTRVRQCHIHLWHSEEWGKASQIATLISVMLCVTNNCPLPHITLFGHPSPNVKTAGGLSRLSFSLLENGELNGINMLHQNPKAELFTASNKQDFSVSHNHSFVCLNQCLRPPSSKSQIKSLIAAPIPVHVMVPIIIRC